MRVNKRQSLVFAALCGCSVYDGGTSDTQASEVTGSATGAEGAETKSGSEPTSTASSG